MQFWDKDSIWQEIQFQVQRSRGPGGQNVNKRNTSVQIWWSIEASSLFDDQQKAWLLAKLQNQLSEEGFVTVRADTHRELEMNKKAAVERLIQLISKALHQEKPRKKTKPTYSSKQRTKKAKQKDSEKKSLRRKPTW